MDILTEQSNLLREQTKNATSHGYVNSVKNLPTVMYTKVPSPEEKTTNQQNGMVTKEPKKRNFT